MKACIYCGTQKGDRRSCCGENHWEEIPDYYEECAAEKLMAHLGREAAIEDDAAADEYNKMTKHDYPACALFRGEKYTSDAGVTPNALAQGREHSERPAGAEG